MNDHYAGEDDSRAAIAESGGRAEMAGGSDDAPSRGGSTLRQKAREALLTGRLPKTKPDSVWGGPGSGATCAVCGARVGGDQLGFELEFARGVNGNEPVTRHVHIPCFGAWEFECQSFLQGAREIGTISDCDRDAKSQRRIP